MRLFLLLVFVLPLGVAAATKSPIRIQSPERVDRGTPAESNGATRNAAVAEVPRRLDLVAKDYAFTGPSTVAAGRRVIALRNEGSKLHHVQLLRLADGKQITDVLSALNTISGIEQLPDWATPVGGPSAALSGATIESEVYLSAGRYAVICWIPTADGAPHYMKGMMMPLDVVDAGRDPAPATGPITTAVVREYGFQFFPPATPGRRTIRVENVGSQPHEFLIVRLENGATVEQVAEWSERGQPGTAPVTQWMGVAAIAPGRSASLTVDFEPGRYAIFCLSPDRADGRSHLAHGMQKTFEIAGS